MNYQRLKDGKLVQMPIRISRASGVEEVYAHGAAGTNVGNYHFRIDFYRDVFPPTEMTVIGNQIIDEGEVTIDRKVVASILIPLPFLKELRNWLNRQVEEVEMEQGEIALPKKDKETPEEELPIAKEA